MTTAAFAGIVTTPTTKQSQEGTATLHGDVFRATVRPLIVAEARTWVHTPYHKRGMLKGVGVDCGMLPYAVLRKFDLIPEIADLPTLEDGWFCNTTAERYARLIERYFRKLLETQAWRDMQAEFLPGNLVLLQSWGSRVFNHGGLITSWPRVINALPEYGVAEVDASVDPFWASQRIAVYDVLEPV